MQSIEESEIKNAFFAHYKCNCIKRTQETGATTGAHYQSNGDDSASQWLAVAIALDRIFFIVYLIFNVVALILIFPRPR